MQDNQTRIPNHVAVIMDGNGRWAQARSLERTEGHVKGIEAVRRVIESAIRHSVRHLTLYTFSTENWGRPRQEVDALMGLLCRCAETETEGLVRNGVRVHFLGLSEGLPQEVRESLETTQRLTAAGERLSLHLAVNYSSRSELVNSARILAGKAAEGAIRPEDIDERTFGGSLLTAGMPDVDLLIRTGGELRLSNFLLWQAAYAELYFTPVLWPDFGEEDFCDALREYAGRDRRWGLVK